MPATVVALIGLLLGAESGRYGVDALVGGLGP
jgi:hypothetical protein